MHPAPGRNCGGEALSKSSRQTAAFGARRNRVAKPTNMRAITPRNRFALDRSREGCNYLCDRKFGFRPPRGRLQQALIWEEIVVIRSRLLAAAMLLVLSTAAAAASPAVTERSVYLRAGPGTAYRVVATLPRNAAID